MAVKSNFASGDILTASDVNTYLTNGGLVYITQTTATNATIAIDNCFTSTYTNYRVIVNFDTVTATGTYQMRLRVGGVANAGAIYNYGGWTNYTNIASTAAQGAGATYWPLGVHTNIAYPIVAVVDVANPQLAKYTNYVNQATCAYNNYVSMQTGGYHVSNTQFDGFQITQDSGGTITATITVFGYRKA